MNQTHTPPRSVRVSDDLWRRAKAQAKKDGVHLSSVIVAYLENYVSEDEDSGAE